MIRFSYSKNIKEKVATFDFKRVEGGFEDLLPHMNNSAIACGVFKDGHRRNENVVECGNLLLIDIDKPIPLETLKSQLQLYKYAICESRSSQEDKRKYHIAIELDRAMPTNKLDYARYYNACMQYLGLEDIADLRFKVMSQQMAPGQRASYHTGYSLSLKDALDCYKPEVESESLGVGVAGVLDQDTVFETELGSLTIAQARDVDKVGCKCVNGYDHGSQWPAFIAQRDDGDMQYFCCGDRCGGKVWLFPEEPMTAIAEQTSVEKRQLGKELRELDAKDFIPQEHMQFLGGDATLMNRETAVASAAKAMLVHMKTIRLTDDIYTFNGLHWEKLFKGDNDLIRFIEGVARDLHQTEIVGNVSALERAARYVFKALPSPVRGEGRNLLNMENCMIEVSKRGVKTYKHNEKAWFTSVIPYKYTPDVKAPTWRKVVDKIMCKDRDLVRSFQESLGYLLLRDFNLEKMICFVGEGANGKSTINEVIKRLVGRSGFSTVPLTTLCKDDNNGMYARATMDGSIINITNELEPKDIRSETFKDLISGVDIQARHPHGSPFTLPHTPKQLVSTNTTRQLIKESTHGFVRRLLMIPFNYTLKEADYDADILDKLTQELPGIFNWVLAGAKRVIRNQVIYEAPSVLQLLEKTITENNSVKYFISKCLDGNTRFDSLNSVQKVNNVANLSQIYEKYLSFCAENHQKPYGKLNFGVELSRFGVQKIDSTTMIEGKKVKLKGFVFPEKRLH